MKMKTIAGLTLTISCLAFALPSAAYQPPSYEAPQYEAPQKESAAYNPPAYQYAPKKELATNPPAYGYTSQKELMELEKLSAKIIADEKSLQQDVDALMRTSVQVRMSLGPAC